MYVIKVKGRDLYVRNNDYYLIDDINKARIYKSKKSASVSCGNIKKFIDFSLMHYGNTNGFTNFAVNNVNSSADLEIREIIVNNVLI